MIRHMGRVSRQTDFRSSSQREAVAGGTSSQEINASRLEPPVVNALDSMEPERHPHGSTCDTPRGWRGNGVRRRRPRHALEVLENTCELRFSRNARRLARGTGLGLLDQRRIGSPWPVASGGDYGRPVLGRGRGRPSCSAGTTLTIRLGRGQAPRRHYSQEPIACTRPDASPRIILDA